jgi:translocation and assembly module TamA
MPFFSIVRIVVRLPGRRAAVVALAVTIAAVGWARDDAALAAGEFANPSFSIEVRAPSPLRDLLERQMELRRYREVADLEDAELDRLMAMAETNVRELAGTLGFFSPRISIRREGGALAKPVVVVEVDPGAPTLVATVGIDFEGDIATSSDPQALAQREEIRSNWRLPAGRVFTQEDWNGAKTSALRQLVRRRYPAGKVSYSLADIDAPRGWAHLGLRLDSGPLFHLGSMKVTGANRYSPLLVPRLAHLAEGSIYDAEKIQEAQLRLAGTGYYDSVFIFVDPESDPRAAPVQVNVREAPLHKVVLGLGLTTDSGLRASAEYLANKVPGLDWRADTKLQLEKKAPFIQTEWTAIPDEDGWRWGVLAKASRVDDGQFITRAAGLRIGRSWAADRIDRNAYVQYDSANVEVLPGVTATPEDTGDGTSLSANFVWNGRYFDRVPFPTRGFAVGFELGGGLTLTGSKSPFQRSVVKWLGIRPLADSRLQFRAEGGAVLARDSARVPSTQLFRTGGDTTVRGYGFRDIGVPLPGGAIGPGRFMAMGSVEWQRPIRRNGVETDFEHTLFVDGGAVSNTLDTLRPVYGVGTGVRWKSPLGPVQADLAYGVKPRKFRLHLNIGMTF